MTSQIVSSSKQTKNWRQNQIWYKTGKSNECEKFQFKLFRKITGLRRHVKYDRLNYDTLEIKSIKNPYVYQNGFEWTEDFDSSNERDGEKYFINMKFVCDNGGAQIRTLKEVYHFIECQLDYLSKNLHDNIFFINILDGDEAHRTSTKFKYLKNKKKYKKITKYVFVGDMKQFEYWWQ